MIVFAAVVVYIFAQFLGYFTMGHVAAKLFCVFNAARRHNLTPDITIKQK